MPIIIKSQRELAIMRAAGQIVAATLARLAEAVRPGVCTAELDEMAHAEATARGAYPAFKGYRGFPASICASINEEIVHGIPSPERVLRAGDIVSLDFGAVFEGFYGDAAITVAVGEVSPEARRLLAVTERALFEGLALARPSGFLSDISHAVQRCAESAGFSVVRQYVGHGIGRAMHEEPQIPNFGPPGRGPRLRPGMTLAIEPMVNIGGPETALLADQWTVVTADGSLSAHFEHTVAITADGHEILTRADERRLGG
ncbi:MAG: type I methionyl aminopeptidase [Chloroflexi bacterium]|nr:type I methionyl aminopeptidase [Chloroflexota bacterium]MBI4507469.1 type I methionyl aminopeptidase [Chloroflexota bacterium]